MKDVSVINHHLYRLLCTDRGVRVGQPVYCRVCNAAEFKPAGETRPIALSHKPLINDIVPIIVVISYQQLNFMRQTYHIALHYFIFIRASS